MNPFIKLIDERRIPDEAALRKTYKSFLKRRHPDLAGAAAQPFDFDRLKREYEDALEYLKADKIQADGIASTFPFDRDRFFQELRDLVARGFPVNEKNLSKNAGYRRCVEYVGQACAHIFADADRFRKINEQLRVLKKSSRDVYWYDNAVRILANALDEKTSGTARRQFAFVEKALENHGFHEARDFFAWVLAARVVEHSP